MQTNFELNPFYGKLLDIRLLPKSIRTDKRCTTEPDSTLHTRARRCPCQRKGTLNIDYATFTYQGGALWNHVAPPFLTKNCFWKSPCVCVPTSEHCEASLWCTANTSLPTHLSRRSFGCHGVRTILYYEMYVAVVVVIDTLLRVHARSLITYHVYLSADIFSLRSWHTSGWAAVTSKACDSFTLATKDKRAAPIASVSCY